MEGARDLIAAEDGERRALERALHDGLLQQLVAAGMELQRGRRALVGDPAAVAVHLDELGLVLDEALAAARALADDLHSALLDEQGLVAALQAAARAAPVPARVEGALTGAVSAPEASTAYRCCVVALRSITGEGARATVRVGANDGWLDFAVEITNGVADRARLAAVVARAAALGGAIDAEPRSISGRLPIRE